MVEDEEGCVCVLEASNGCVFFLRDMSSVEKARKGVMLGWEHLQQGSCYKIKISGVLQARAGLESS